MDKNSDQAIPNGKIPLLSVLREDHLVYRGVQSNLLSCLWGSEIINVRIMYRNLEIAEHRIARIDELYQNLIAFVASRQTDTNGTYESPTPVIVSSYIERIRFEYEKISAVLRNIVGSAHYDKAISNQDIKKNLDVWENYRDCARKLFISLKSATFTLLVFPIFILIVGVYFILFGGQPMQFFSEHPIVIEHALIAALVLSVIWLIWFYRYFLKPP